MELYLCSCWAFFNMEKAGLSGPQSRCMKASGFFVAVNAICRVCKLFILGLLQNLKKGEQQPFSIV